MKKSLTIPGLEFLGNYNLSKLVYNVISDIEVKNILCWKDSQISLARNKDINLEFETFVQISLIPVRNNVFPDNWRFCRSALKNWRV